VRELRARHPELAIDLQRIAKSGLIARASGAPLRLGFDRARCKELSHLFTNRRIAPNPRPGGTVAQYLEFADWLGLAPSPPRYDLPDEPWPGPPPRAGRPRVCVNVGASKPANRWPPERFAAVCEGLARELGAELFLTGGPSDRASAELVLEKCGAPLSDQVGKLSLKQSAGLIRSAELFIGCDTGPLHVAVAVGTRVVALFGAADPARTGPFGQPGGVVSRPAPCSPCRRRTCNVSGHPCMDDIQPAAVLERALAVLARPRS
jgi:ADP-heptose:LPS heptosyltransferase